MSTSQPTNWKHLEPRPCSSYRQLFLKGRRIRACTIYNMHLSEEEPMTPEEIAADYDLPVEAVREAIAYCQTNPREVEGDYLREEARVKAEGLDDPNSRFHPTPKPLSPQEIARIDRMYQ